MALSRPNASNSFVSAVSNSEDKLSVGLISGTNNLEDNVTTSTQIPRINAQLQEMFAFSLVPSAFHENEAQVSFERLSICAALRLDTQVRGDGHAGAHDDGHDHPKTQSAESTRRGTPYVVLQSCLAKALTLELRWAPLDPLSIATLKSYGDPKIVPRLFTQVM